MDPDDLLSYSTLKIVKIRDRRLGALHYLLQLGIFIYIIIYTIVIQQRYLKSEIPFGSIRSTIQEPATLDAKSLPYCLQNQPTLNGRANYNCTFMLGRDLSYPPAIMDSIFVSTRLKDTYYYPPNCGSTIGVDEIVTNFACISALTNVSVENRYYLGGIENYTVYIEHAIYGEVTDIVTTNADLKGELEYSDGSKRELTDADRLDTGDVFDLSEILQAAGIDSLDSDSTVNAANSKRYDGVLVLVIIQYSNRASAPSQFKYTYSFKVLTGVDVIVQEPSVVQPNGQIMARSRYGVHFMYLVTGSIGKFDFQVLLTSIVAGLVLLGIATTIVDVLMIYGPIKLMPQKSLYKETKYELSKDFSDVRKEKKQEKDSSRIAVYSDSTVNEGSVAIAN